MDRIRAHLIPNSAPQTDAAFWVIFGEFGSFRISRATAHHLMRSLDRVWQAKWLCFTDLFGSRVRVRARHVRGVLECTKPQRVRERALDRALERELTEERTSWED